MNPLATTSLILLLGAQAGTARAELVVVRESEPVRLFAGAARTFPVVWRNTGKVAIRADVRMRLLQASSATTVPVSEWPWKQLQVLPGQTVLEHATLDFPEVRAETRFIVQWLGDSSGTGFQPVHGVGAPEKGGASSASTEQTGKMPVPLLGTTEVLVYPSNLLTQLKSLAGKDQPVGVFDPDNTFKPLLKIVGVEYEDLQDSAVADFCGRLAVVGPFTSATSMPADLAERAAKLARQGACVVWFLPPPGPDAKLQPTFYTVVAGTNAVVVGQAQLVANLADDPRSQLNLLQLCRLALHPEPARLPESTTQP